MAAIISLAFLVTNLPYMVQEMLLAFAPHVSLGPHATAVFGVISASNSALNPYIYLAFNGGSGSTVCGARGVWRHLTRSFGFQEKAPSRFARGGPRSRQPIARGAPAMPELPLAHDAEHDEMEDEAG
ncbi:hypothetical protein MRX96_035091 [Rhipicephalus microplus]